MTFLRVFLFTLVFARVLSAQEPASPEILQKLQETQQLHQEHRYAEALTKLDEIEAANPNLADVYNIRGSIYLTPGLRDFDLAQKYFQKAESLQPGSLAPRFNMSELLFVKHEWASAAASFQKVLEDYPKLRFQVRHLTLFKLLVCQVKLGKLDEAEKILSSNFTFMDDTPAYYFGHAAIAFGKKEDSKAKEWLSRASGIYKPDVNTAYLDTLMEARWVPNISLPPVEKK